MKLIGSLSVVSFASIKNGCAEDHWESFSSHPRSAGQRRQRPHGLENISEAWKPQKPSELDMTVEIIAGRAVNGSALIKQYGSGS